jgi:hypothetical protein
LSSFLSNPLPFNYHLSSFFGHSFSLSQFNSIECACTFYLLLSNFSDFFAHSLRHLSLLHIKYNPLSKFFFLA